MIGRNQLLVGCLSLWMGGCGMGTHDEPDLAVPPSADMSAPDLSAAAPDLATTPLMATRQIDADGGVVSATNGLSLTFPPAAIDDGTQVTISEVTTPPPVDMGVVSPVYQFGPEGTVFAHPVTVSIPLPPGAPANTRLFWSRHDGPGFDNVGGTIVGNFLQAAVTHFSEGFLAAGTTARTISGTRQITWFSAAANVVNAPTDLSTGLVEALVPAMGGGYTAVAGSGAADGTFSIANVPDGPVFVHTRPAGGSDSFVLTGGSAVDSSTAQLGRPDRVDLTSTTTLVLNLSNLDTWQTGDSLELFIPNVDNWWFGLEASGIPGLPNAGDTQITGLTMTPNTGDSDGEPGRVIDGGKGDIATVEHLATHSLGGNSGYIAVSRIATLPSFTMADGSSTTVNGTFTDVSASNSVAFTVLGTKFLQYTTACNPNAQTFPASSFGPVSVFIVDQPGGQNFAGQSANADLLGLWTDSDLTTPTMSYGTPLAGNWGPTMVANMTYTVSYLAAGATTPTLIYAHLNVFDTVAHLTASSIQPTISPVQMAKINGNDLFTSQTSLGTTPTLSWQPPAAGTPDWYVVVVTAITNNGGNTRQQRLAQLITTQTSLQIPPNLLTAGQSYVFTIVAGAGGNPFQAQSSLPSARADLLSALQTM